jgi:TolA-binding protein|tara:strand:+ start:479 stop:694 length:216 start_codon:yes stop_codon:yes gene_type:complete
MAIEIAQKIEAMEAEIVRTQEVRQNALRQAQEAEAMLQRQAGYIAGLREIQEAEAQANGQVEVEEPEAVEA